MTGGTRPGVAAVPRRGAARARKAAAAAVAAAGVAAALLLIRGRRRPAELTERHQAGLTQRRPAGLRLRRGIGALRLAARGGARYASNAPRLFAAAGENRQRLRNDLALQTAEDVARTGLNGLDKNHAVVVSGGVNRVSAVLSSMTPHAITRRASAFVVGRNAN